MIVKDYSSGTSDRYKKLEEIKVEIKELPE